MEVVGWQDGYRTTEGHPKSTKKLTEDSKEDKEMLRLSLHTSKEAAVEWYRNYIESLQREVENQKNLLKDEKNVPAKDQTKEWESHIKWRQGMVNHYKRRVRKFQKELEEML